MVSVLTDRVGQVLIDGDTACFQCLGGDLLLFVTDQVSDEGEEIDGSFLGSHVVDTDFGFGDTATVAGFDVGLVLLVAVATEGATSHGGKLVWSVEL